MIRSNLRDAFDALKAEPWAQMFLASWILFDAYRVCEASGWLGLGC